MQKSKVYEKKNKRFVISLFFFIWKVCSNILWSVLNELISFLVLRSVVKVSIYTNSYWIRPWPTIRRLYNNNRWWINAFFSIFFLLFQLSVATWSELITKFKFVCPKCLNKFTRVNLLAQHMKCCLRVIKSFFEAYVKCPECDRVIHFEKLAHHFRSKHVLVSIFQFYIQILGCWVNLTKIAFIAFLHIGVFLKYFFLVFSHLSLVKSFLSHNPKRDYLTAFTAPYIFLRVIFILVELVSPWTREGKLGNMSELQMC